MNKKKHIIVILTILILFIALSGVKIKKRDKNAINNEEKLQTQLNLGIPIETMRVGKSDLIESINYVGTIKPTKSVAISPVIGGQIVDIYVEEGDQVNKGDLLAKIDDKQLKANLDGVLKKLETLKENNSYLEEEIKKFYISNPLIKKLEVLESNYKYLDGESKKYERLYCEGAISKSLYEKIKQEADIAYLQLEELKATIDDTYNKLLHEKNITEKQMEELNSSINELHIKNEYTLIKSPIQGIVNSVYYEIGEYAAIGKPFISVDDNNELIVEVNIPENDLNKISTSNKVVLKSKESSKEVVTKIKKIFPSVNPSTRIGVIEIGPINPDESIKLVSGNSVDVNIITNEAKDKIIIPKNAIKRLNNEKIVYQYKDGIVKEIKISTGLIVEDSVEVVKGLKEGDKIAVKNLSKLYDGAKVYVFKGVD